MEPTFFQLYVNIPEDGESYPVVVGSDGGIHTPDGGDPTLLAQADLGQVLLALVEQECGNFALEINRLAPQDRVYRNGRGWVPVGDLIPHRS